MGTRRLLGLVAIAAVASAVVAGAATPVAGGASTAGTTGSEIFVPAASELAAQLQVTPLAIGADIRAVGGGWSNLGTQHFDLSAHTGPNGDFGHYGTEVYDPFGALIVRYKVDVDCVNVHGPGERAVIKGSVKSVSPVPNVLGITPGHRVILGVDDESNPGDPVELDDWFAPHADTFPGNCKNVVYIANVNNVTQGNINIKLG
ncbi:MAG: hypothetical protein M3321_07485 [Actinomycetota bacterium]|nr:hypothetical protein [Actinomycetota bacterium]